MPENGGVLWRDGVRDWNVTYAMNPELSLKYDIAASRKERIELRTAKAQTGNLAVGRRDDAKGLSGRLTHLNSHPCSHIDTIVLIHTHAVGAALVDGIDMEIIVTLFVDERPIRLNQIAINLADAAVGDAKKPPVGGKGNAGGLLQIGVDDAPFAGAIDEPKPASCRFTADRINIAVGAHGKAMTRDVFGEHSDLGVGVVGQNVIACGCI